MIKTYKIEIKDKFIITTMEVIVDGLLVIEEKKCKIGELCEYTDLSIRNLDGSSILENQTVSDMVIDTLHKVQKFVDDEIKQINEFLKEIS